MTTSPDHDITIIGAGFSATMISRLGPRILLTVGPFIAGTGMLLLGLFLEPDSRYVGLILPAQLIMAIGMGVTFPALVSGAVSGVPQENSGIASALLNAAQQVGGAVGSEEAVGRPILIPNAMLFSNVVINYTARQDAAFLQQFIQARRARRRRRAPTSWSI